MIRLKNSEQIAVMRIAGRITAEALLSARDHIRSGVSTKYIDEIIREYIEKCGAKPSFLGYSGFPGSACISINDEIIHGIPSPKRILEDGDIVKIDVGAYYNGFHGDSARTYAVGQIAENAKRLIETTEKCFWLGYAQIKEGNRLGDVGYAIQSHAESAGYGVVRKYIGHGIGMDLHEMPDVPNYGTPGRGQRLTAGLAIAVEPMINEGPGTVKELPDGWTVKTADGRLSAHYENTVVLTFDGPIITTSAE